MAKSIALGADLAAFGQPLLASALESAEEVVEFISGIIHEFKVAMLCAGARDLAALRKAPWTQLRRCAGIGVMLRATGSVSRNCKLETRN